MEVSLLYVTTETRDEAIKISQIVVREELAACSNIFGEINSIFNWKGNICSETETAFILKTSQKKTKSLINRIRELHSYEIPCILEINISNGNKEFIKWVNKQTEIDGKID